MSRLLSDDTMVAGWRIGDERRQLGSEQIPAAW
jgi:hypothetical protein